ncbi:protein NONRESPONDING TO OXYLIPINS 2, mitochondrial-like isoform X2 [Silene latifolia]|uniref:protein NONRESPONDING TO OXYLIPINS 2, mitochondrial-like isoform X2 n=1 Tax=Silene latifolia TaxID=37657 RepID=UPI003D786E64
MASKCGRFINRASLSSIRSSFAKQSAASSAKSSASPFPRFTFSRIPRELGGVASMMPLHNAVATARLMSCLSTTSRSCRALSQELGLSVPR